MNCLKERIRGHLKSDLISCLWDENCNLVRQSSTMWSFRMTQKAMDVGYLTASFLNAFEHFDKGFDLLNELQMRLNEIKRSD